MPIVGLSDLEKIGLDINEYVIIGSAAAIAHGMPKTNLDLDVMVRDGVQADPTGILDIRSQVLNDKISKAEIFETSVVIDGYRFMGIETLVKFYEELSQKTKQPKHFATLEWLNGLYK